MSQATLERILEDIKTLEPEELHRVQQAVSTQLSTRGYSPEEEMVLQNMLRDGLLTEIKPRRTASSSGRQRIQVQGIPVSETIIEERR